MITMMEKLEIITLHLKNQSNRSIAKALGIDKKTVNKYVAEYERAQAALTQPEMSDKEKLRKATEVATASPEYKKRNSPARKWSLEMDEFLNKILVAEAKKAELLHTKKQQLTKYQILGLMQEAGFDIGYTTVCRKINEKRAVKKEAFIAQNYRYGQRFEFDFGEVHLHIADKLTKAFIAVMSAPASGYRYARIYRNQKFDVFIDSQVRFFEHMGGCFEEGVYDNMRNVVKKFVGKNEKELNEGLVKLALYYGFRVNVTNVYAGNEKGTVERSVDVVRNAAFALNWKFDSLADAQVALDSALEKLNENVCVEKERAALTPYRPPYEVADIVSECIVDKYSCVRYDKVSYSVPDCFVGKHMCIKAYPTEIVILHKGSEVARHARSYKSKDMVLELGHYLTTFNKKPGALANSCALATKTELAEVFKSEYADNPREFISILNECKDDSVEDTLLALKDHMRKKKVYLKEARDDDPIALATQRQIERIGAIGKDVA